MGFLLLLVAWIVGGVTFVPTLLILVLAYAHLTSPKLHADSNASPKKTLPHDDLSQSATSNAGSKTIKSGWLAVRRTYEPLPSEGTYTSLITSGYKSLMDSRSKDPRRLKPKDAFYAILKQTSQSAVLFLYDCDPVTLDSSECWAAIDCSAFDTTLYPTQASTPDGELWMKRTALVLKPKHADVALSNSAVEGVTDALDSKDLPWFFFPKTNVDKEDWYYALLSCTNPTTSSSGAMFDPNDIGLLVENIDAQPDALPTRWLNAMLGRLFLSVYRSETLESYIVNKIVRKLNRVKTPSYLSDICVREVHVGNQAPLFSKPMLKELTPDGQASMEVNISFKGELRVTISAVATLSLGGRFKTYNVNLVLAVVLKELEGTLLLKIKRPPSNRLWFGFSTAPRMVLSVEPVVSDRQIKWSMILKSIESRIKEVLLESIVLPNLDDIAFFDTRAYTHRGGIFDDAARKHEDLSTAGPAPSEEAEAPVAVTLDGVPIDQQNDTVAESGLRRRNGNAAEVAPSQKANSILSLSRTATQESVDSTASIHSKQDKMKSWFASSKNLLSSNSSSVTSIDTANSDDSTQTKRNVPPPFSNRTATASSSSLAPSTVSSSSLAPTKENETLLSTQEQEREKEKETETAAERLNKLLSQDMARKTSGEPLSTSPPLQTDHAMLSSTKSDTSTLSSSRGSTNPFMPPLPEQESAGEAREVVANKAAAPRSMSPQKQFWVARDVPNGAPVPVPTKYDFQPPPKRVHDASPEKPSESSPARENLLHTWRSKAADKQALTAGYSQAKDALMKKWGNGAWSKARSQSVSDDSVFQPPASGSGSVSGTSEAVAESRSVPEASVAASTANPSTRPPPRATRASSISSKTGPTTQLMTTLSNSPEPSFTYRATPQMAIPQVDPAHRGGLGNSGPLEIKPVKPGDVEEKPKLGFGRWTERKVPVASSSASLVPSRAPDVFSSDESSSTSGAGSLGSSTTRKVPPPYFPRKPAPTVDSEAHLADVGSADPLPVDGNDENKSTSQTPEGVIDKAPSATLTTTLTVPTEANQHPAAVEMQADADVDAEADANVPLLQPDSSQPHQESLVPLVSLDTQQSTTSETDMDSSLVTTATDENQPQNANAMVSGDDPDAEDVAKSWGLEV